MTTYDKVMMNLWRSYGHLMIFRKAGPWSANCGV